jgi:hypothetical protein
VQLGRLAQQYMQNVARVDHVAGVGVGGGVQEDRDELQESANHYLQEKMS